MPLPNAKREERPSDHRDASTDDPAGPAVARASDATRPDSDAGSDVDSRPSSPGSLAAGDFDSKQEETDLWLAATMAGVRAGDTDATSAAASKLVDVAGSDLQGVHAANMTMLSGTASDKMKNAVQNVRWGLRPYCGGKADINALPCAPASSPGVHHGDDSFQTQVQAKQSSCAWRR